MQKDLLGQDVFLIGPPGPRRRKLALQYLELTNREHEYIALSRDTTESDIKQRREIVGGAAKYFDQVSRDRSECGDVRFRFGLEMIVLECCSCGYDGKGVSFGGYRKS